MHGPQDHDFSVNVYFTTERKEGGRGERESAPNTHGAVSVWVCHVWRNAACVQLGRPGRLVVQVTVPSRLGSLRWAPSRRPGFWEACTDQLWQPSLVGAETGVQVAGEETALHVPHPRCAPGVQRSQRARPFLPRGHENKVSSGYTAVLPGGRGPGPGRGFRLLLSQGPRLSARDTVCSRGSATSFSPAQREGRWDGSRGPGLPTNLPKAWGSLTQPPRFHRYWRSWREEEGRAPTGGLWGVTPNNSRWRAPMPVHPGLGSCLTDLPQRPGVPGWMPVSPEGSRGLSSGPGSQQPPPSRPGQQHRGKSPEAPGTSARHRWGDWAPSPSLHLSFFIWKTRSVHHWQGWARNPLPSASLTPSLSRHPRSWQQPQLLCPWRAPPILSAPGHYQPQLRPHLLQEGLPEHPLTLRR